MSELKFTIEPKPLCGFLITSKKEEEYYNSILLTRVIYNAVKESDVTINYYRLLSLDDPNITHYGNDGWYSILQILIPKKPEGEEVSLPPFYWDYNQNGIIMLYNEEEAPTLTESVFEYIDRLPNQGWFTVSTTYEFFLLCLLWECYITYSLSLLSNCIGKCEKKDTDLNFKRDMVWMTLNVLNYYKELQTKFSEDHFAQMLLILENFINCYGMCNNISVKSVSSCGCHL